MRRSPDAVMSRTAAALIGGYIVANAVAICLAAALPLPRADAVLVALQASYLLYLMAALWAFAARSATSAWAGLAIVSVISLCLWGWLRFG